VRFASLLLWAAAGLFVLAAPLFLDRGMLNDVWNLAFGVILASAWNLLGGFAGQVSLGYSAFLGIRSAL
jgi:branched-chain amino acid transport system permease protein